MTATPRLRWAGLLLGLAGVLLTGCTMTGARGGTVRTIARATDNGDCPSTIVTGTAPGLAQTQEANAKIVVGVALGRGLGPTGAAIAVAAALAESSLYNYANDGTSTLVGSAEHRQLSDTERVVARESLNYPHDRVGNNLDSIGLFQKRPMPGWGTPDQLINPATATGKFLDQMVKVLGWQTLSPWTVAQMVQGSPSTDGGIYRDSHQRANAIVASLDTTPTAPVATTAESLPVAVVQATVSSSNCGQSTPAASVGGGAATWGGYQNGRIPGNALCPVPSAPTLQLECAAATAFDQLNTAFKAAIGRNIGITDAYRSYQEQVACRLEKGSLCANPGTSNHGWGKAVDIGGCCGIDSGTGAAFDWLTANAGRYAWNHPAWTQPGGSKPEPWHWEYGEIS